MEKKFMRTNINLNSLIYPYFVRSSVNKKEKIISFPGVFRFSLDRLLKDIEEIRGLGLNKILLFGIPDRKDIFGREAFKEDNIVALAVREIKKSFPDLIVMTDVCLCAYTAHGHCGILKKTIADRDFIAHTETLNTLAKIALSHAAAGADFVAPSAMAKKQVGIIRNVLDAAGFKKTKILGYSAKFASNFYGPFRNACASRPKFADRSSYQLNYTDYKRALIEVKEDIREGANVVMVKPALSYLDIIREVKEKYSYPLAAYNTSGEYAMVKTYCRTKDEERNLVSEILTSIKRAGADYIISYHAKDVARWLTI